MSAAQIVACGMTTAIGLSAAASCAAFRARLDNFQETRFIDGQGGWLFGAEVPFEDGVRGTARLARLAVGPMRECLEGAGLTLPEVPLLLCLAERDRPGRPAALEADLLAGIESAFAAETHEDTKIYAYGQVGGAVALRDAKGLLERGAKAVLIAGIDSYFNAAAISAFIADHRILSDANTNGFILGEAGAAVLVRSEGAGLAVRGLGFGTEKAHITSGDPLRADGMVTAMRTAFEEAGIVYDDIAYRIADLDGEQYYFREAALAQARLWRGARDPEDIWLPCDGMGQTGAAVVPICLGVGLVAAQKGYAPGPIALIHTADDAGRRAAIVTEGAA
ncbi:MAG: hypothetical protein AAF848_13660 [Pseudomonadota bacterium]